MKQKFLKAYCHFLGRLARGYLSKHKPYIIGVNGSVGKTSCRLIIAQTLQKLLPKHFRVWTSSENFNGELGMPLSIFCIDHIRPCLRSFCVTALRCIWERFFAPKRYDCIVLEYGIDYPGEMEFLLSIAHPDIGVFTKIDAVHSEQFGTPQAIAQAESLMVRHARDVVFLNADDVYARQLYGKLDVDTFLYVTTKQEEKMYPTKPHIDWSDASLKNDANCIAVSFFVAHNAEVKRKVQTNVIGKENYGYIAVALAIYDVIKWRIENQGKDTQQDFSKKEKSSGKSLLKSNDTYVLSYSLLPGRCSLFWGIRQSIVIDSTYNAAPASMRKMIENTYQLRQELYPSYKICLVLGDMRELGDFAELEHRQLAGVISHGSDKIILVGECMKKWTYDELLKIGTPEDKITVCQTSLEAGKLLYSFLYDSSDRRIILFKGSQNTIFLEEAVKYVLDGECGSLCYKKILVRQDSVRRKKKEKFFGEKIR